jgi:ribosomal-protein-alanine N-acetyltransferase
MLLRRPVRDDASSIFDRYASDPDVCHYLSWPLHRTVEDTLAFLQFSDSEWSKWPAGPYLMFALDDGRLLGSTGLAFDIPDRSAAGYVLAKDSWGQGYATEAMLAMRQLCTDLNVSRLYACCHPDHIASRRVLEKSGLLLEPNHSHQLIFPNIDLANPQDVVCYVCSPTE